MFKSISTALFPMLAALFAATGPARAATLPADVMAFTDSAVDLPAGARGIVRLAPGGGMGTLGQNGWSSANVDLGDLVAGTLVITVTDLGPATCNGTTCTPVGANYPGNTFLQGDIFELIVNGNTAGFTQPLTANDDPETPIAYVANLNTATFVETIAAGNVTLDFDNLTTGYLNEKWPAASIEQNNDGDNIVPSAFTTAAFQVAVAYAPEPSAFSLIALGLAATVAWSRRRASA